MHNIDLHSTIMASVANPEAPASSNGSAAPELQHSSSEEQVPPDEMSRQLLEEALQVERNEPELTVLLRRTILSPCVKTLEDAVASTICYRLLLQPCSGSVGNKSAGNSAAQPVAMFCPNTLKDLIRSCLDSPLLECGHTMADAVRHDIEAVCRRDPAMDTYLQVILFSKGFGALVCHRAAHRLVKTRKFTALFLQSQGSAVFGVDLHPSAQIGSAVMLDHGTGIVVGETAVIGDGCTLLHGVTLGGTGKDQGDRHPKVGRNCLIGAGASLLGNIVIGDGAKIGAGSVVLRAIPAGATAVGAPAKIIGRAKEANPGSDMDETLTNVTVFHKSTSSLATTASSSSVESEDDDGGGEDATAVAVPTQQRRQTMPPRFRITEDRSCMCPFRGYTRLSLSGPKGSVTLWTLSDLLEPLGCTDDEIGSCLFALDTKSVGHVRKEVFCELGVDAIVQNTKLDVATAENAVSSYFAEHTQ